MPVNEFRNETSEPVTHRIVTAIAEETGSDPLSLPPLYWTVDPDSLIALVEAGPDGDGEEALTVTFEHAGCTVSVSSTAEVDVTTTSV